MPTWELASRGVGWRIELDRDQLLPGRLVAGRVAISAGESLEARRIVVTLIGTEAWQHDQTSTDAQGHIHTETVTSTAELPRVPVEVAGPLALAAGESRVFPFELPVPPLGPASVEATVLRVTWIVEAKADSPGFDSRVEVPVRILQPTALLRAGVVEVGAYALFPEADAIAGDVTGSVELDPLPLVLGAPFRGRLVVRAGQPHRLQDIRAEIRVRVEATVPSGKSETITAWAGTVAAAMSLEGEQTLSVTGPLPDTALPTIETAHGRAAATFHVILATEFARDPHLVRDVTIASTAEL